MNDAPDDLRLLAEDAIRQRILQGELAFGARLSDRSLGAMLGIGRTPVREAIARLEQAGLVSVRAKSGSFVWSPDVTAVRELCEMRAILECGALRLAVGRDPERLAAALAVPLAGGTLALEAGDTGRAEAMDTRFHEALVGCSGNELLIDAYRSISDKVTALRHRIPHDRARMAAALAQHRRILDLALAGTPRDAEAELAAHVRNVQGRTVELVKVP
ncbi:GntR family transcriptional regulator [Roseomonas sp. WA12]